MADSSIDVLSLQKLKVADLKKLLKERGLSMAGNKAELILRLQGKSAGAEALDTSQDETDDLLEESNDEDAAADTSELTADSLVGSPVAPNAPPALVKATSEAPAVALATKPKITRIEVSSVKAVADDKLKQRLQRFGAVSEDIKKQARADRFHSASGAADKTAAVTPATTATSSTKKVSGPVIVSASAAIVAEQEKLKKRSERFGTGTTAAAVATPSTAASGVATTAGKSASLEALKKRAERFGELTSSSLTKVNEQERVLKRKNRFGTILAPSTNGSASDPSSEAKKLKRAERFNIVAA